MPRKRKEQPSGFDKAFPTAMRNLMEQKGTTQNELADYLQKTRQSVSYYCDGSSSPDWETIVKIADFFNVSTDYLLGRTKDPDRSPCAIDELGMSERALDWLKGLKQSSDSRNNMAADISNIMEDARFQLLMHSLREYGKAITAEAIYDREWDRYFPDSCVINQNVAYEHHEEFKETISRIIKSDQCDGYVSKYLKIMFLLNPENASNAELNDLLIGADGFTPSQLCAYRANKFLTLLMKKIESDAFKKGEYLSCVPVLR